MNQLEIQKEIADWESILKTQNETLAQVESMIPGIDPRQLASLQAELAGVLNLCVPGHQTTVAMEMNTSAAGHLGMALSYLLAKFVATHAQKKLNEYKAQVN